MSGYFWPAFYEETIREEVERAKLVADRLQDEDAAEIIRRLSALAETLFGELESWRHAAQYDE